jgi:hypothetical protein
MMTFSITINKLWFVTISKMLLNITALDTQCF